MYFGLRSSQVQGEIHNSWYKKLFPEKRVSGNQMGP